MSEKLHAISVEVNGERCPADVPARLSLVDWLRDHLRLTGTHIGCEHGTCGACSIMLDGEAVRSCLIFAVQADGHRVTTVEGLCRKDGKPGLVQDSFCETHAMQCGYCTPGMLIAAQALLDSNPRPTEEEIREAIGGNLCRCTGYQQIVDAIELAGEGAALASGSGLAALRTEGKIGDRPRFSWPTAIRKTWSVPDFSVTSLPPTSDPDFRYIGKHRRTKEDPRFVMGRGRFVADVALPNMKHVAIVASPHAAARIVSIDVSRALALPGVHFALGGEEFCDATDTLVIGVDAPQVTRYALARGVVRYVGEWVVAVVADTRAIAEDAAELVEVEYEPLPCVIDPEEAIREGSPLVHPAHGSNVILHRHFVWGPVEDTFARAEHRLHHRIRWGRSSTVPIETFGVVAQWNPGHEMLDVWASIQMPKFPDQLARALRLPGNAVRVHYDVDVGGSYGLKRGLKHCVLVGYLARHLGMPVRFIEDRLENMRGGDMHGPDRIFDVDAAFDGDGTVRALRIRAIDDVGAYAGRSPFQLGKPATAICGPYRIAAVEYEPIAVLTNKTPEEAVRGFGQSPTNFALERTLDEIARKLGLDRIEIRRRNFIRRDEFPWRIPSGSTYDSGDYHTVLDKALDAADYPQLEAQRDDARRAGRLAGIGISTCLEPSGGNSAFEPLLNRKNDTTTWMDSCLVRVDLSGAITGVMGTSSSGQGHETLVSTVIGEVLERDPASIRVIHADSLQALPSNSPVGSRMAIMLGGAAAGAARRIRETLIEIAAHNFKCSIEAVEYRDGDCSVRSEPDKRLTWDELVTIAHRKMHGMPSGIEPGLQAKFVWNVPTGGVLPAPDDTIQIYPCYSFEAHVVYVEIDPDTAAPAIRKYVCGHDCGVMISPDIVHGMTYGGIAHGIGAALYEKFSYSDDGQLMSGTFMDYLLPSAMEVPPIEIVDHCTPSPLTTFGQKGSGEAGYLGGPAAIGNAINDALQPLGATLNETPMTHDALWRVIHTARTKDP